MSVLKTPVLFVVFNRPSLTTKTFARIRECKPSKLYVSADGPRTGVLSDRLLCMETRSIVSSIDWPCECKILFHDNNLGCAYAVSTAITWFFGHEEEGIILEDDCCPDPSFFSYCSDLLDRYRDDKRVMAICGSGFVPPSVSGKADYYFSKYPMVWGWATWKRAWEKYSLELENDAKLEHVSRLYGASRIESDFWLSIWREERDHGPNTWDYQWYYWVWSHHGLAIHPRVNLVENIGFGPDATHTTSGKCPPSEPLVLSTHSRWVRRSVVSDRYLAKNIYCIPEISFCSVLRMRIGRLRRFGLNVFQRAVMRLFRN